jgi:hypothetical protein
MLLKPKKGLHHKIMTQVTNYSRFKSVNLKIKKKMKGTFVCSKHV